MTDDPQPREWILKFRASDSLDIDDIARGHKTVETRAATPRYRQIQKGDSLMFVCAGKKLKKVVKEIKHYPSIGALFKAVPLASVMPRARTLTEARRTYYSYIGYKAKLKQYGLLAFFLDQNK